MYYVFSLTLLVSAGLVFLVQPLVGKMILPVLGGAPAVWNTCLVFFQGCLLLGYLYAYAQSRYLSLGKQLISHAAFLLAACVFLPISLPADWSPPTTSAYPIMWLLMFLGVTVGLPFVGVSATAPLLQNWFAHSRDPRAADPYFLYVASNVGSMVGLLAYPFFLERILTLSEQSITWSAGYGFFFLCTVLGAVILWRSGPSEAPAQVLSPEGNADASPSPSDRMLRLRWLLLAAVPSSLLQSVSTYLTTHLAPIPLLWVIPLALYLLTFILVFARTRPIPHTWMVRTLPPLLIVTVVVVFWWTPGSFIGLSLLSLSTLFVAGMACHGEMVRLRPSAARLTEFYLIMATGGVLGGIFNAIVAPLVFDTLAEYPIALAVTGMLMPALTETRHELRLLAFDVVLPVCVGVVLAGVIWAYQSVDGSVLESWQSAILAGIAGLVVYCFRSRPLRFGLGIGAVLAAGLLTGLAHKMPGLVTVHAERSFFSVLRVDWVEKDNHLELLHGNIIHGAQWCGADRKREPTMYFHRRGPIGDVFRALSPAPSGRRVGVVGLGAGTLAAYARPRDHWVFYEIDPAVFHLASSGELFTFLPDCEGKVDVVLGDARLSMESEPDGEFDVLILDAFTSDTVPVHLLTREALQLYLSKLDSSGVIAFHISNKYVRLSRVLYKLCEDAGLVGLRQRTLNSKGEYLWPGARHSDWVVMARKKEFLGALVDSHRWKPLVSAKPVSRVWTDDFSNLIEFLSFSHLLSAQ